MFRWTRRNERTILRRGVRVPKIAAVSFVFCPWGNLQLPDGLYLANFSFVVVFFSICFAAGSVMPSDFGMAGHFLSLCDFQDFKVKTKCFWQICCFFLRAQRANTLRVDSRFYGILHKFAFGGKEQHHMRNGRLPVRFCRGVMCTTSMCRISRHWFCVQLTNVSQLNCWVRSMLHDLQYSRFPESQGWAEAGNEDRIHVSPPESDTIS